VAIRRTDAAIAAQNFRKVYFIYRLILKSTYLQTTERLFFPQNQNPAHGKTAGRIFLL
jgi:hypothetical protein